jgi:hypothetical protein
MLPATQPFHLCVTTHYHFWLNYRKLQEGNLPNNLHTMRFQVLKVMSTRMAVIRIVTHSLAEVYWCLRGACCIHHQSNDNGRSKHLWGISKLLPDYMAQQPRWLLSSICNQVCLESSNMISDTYSIIQSIPFPLQTIHTCNFLINKIKTYFWSAQYIMKFTNSNCSLRPLLFSD